MSLPTDALTCTHWEGSDLNLMARVLSISATPIVQATIASLAVYVYDLSTGEQVGSTDAPLPANTVFDIYQTDARWTVDSIGYNFRYLVDGSYFPEGDRDYQIEVMFTPLTGKPFPLVAIVSVKNLRSHGSA